MAVQRYQYHIVKATFAYICQGEKPWVALGNFLNEWWYYSVEYRDELIAEPPDVAPTTALRRWEAFCAAMVEWLCEQDNVACPEWTNCSRYILSKPWFFDKDWESRSPLFARSFSAFQKRNIYGGNRLFLGKKDLKVEYAHTTHRWTPEEMGMG